jgi:catechol 2,3-dioxygenase-like lactoylglutathione lyase family enzyme
MPRKPIVTREDLPFKPRVLQLSIRTSDLDRADAFYTTVLGLERRGKYRPTPTTEERFYGFESEPAETLICLVHFSDQPHEPAAAGMMAHVIFNLTVPDVRSIVDRTVAGGGTILRDMITQQALDFTQDMAFITDPDGTTIELTHFY